MADLQKDDDFDAAFAEAVAEADGVKIDTPELEGDETKPENEAKPESEEKPEGEAKPESEEKPEGETKPESEEKPEGEANLDDEAAAKTKLVAATSRGAKAKPETRVEPEPKAAAEVKATPEPRVEPEIKAVAKPEPPAETPEQKAAREQFEESIKPYEPTAEEKAAIDKMRADFPNEYAAMEAKFKATDRDINARVYAAVKSVLDHVNSTVTPLAEGFNAASAEQHFAAIRNAHKDYDSVIAKVPEWIDTQPTYLQPALKRVYEAGTTKDVIDLVTDFKKSTGLLAASTEGTDVVAEEKHFSDIKAAHSDYDAVIDKIPAWISKQPVYMRSALQQVYESGSTQDVIDLIADFKKATVSAPATTPKPVTTKPQDVADLAPVSTKRVTTLPKGSPDKNDFDAAWNEAVRELGG